MASLFPAYSVNPHPRKNEVPLQAQALAILKKREALEVLARRGIDFSSPNVTNTGEPVYTPQPGPQEQFYRCSADICIYGGSAFGGKSFALLAEPLKHKDVPGFNAVLFRRTSKQAEQEGGLWDSSQEMYRKAGGQGIAGLLEWRFPSGVTVRLSHMEHEQNRHDWYGAQLAFIGFDELQTFTEKQFWFLLSRNRSMCGVKPYLRATCNPSPDSWLSELLSWWIDQETGYAIEKRSGVIRYLVRHQHDDSLMWFDEHAEAHAYCREHYPINPHTGEPEASAKSFTFIRSSIYDNKLGLEKDPGYLVNLNTLPQLEREQLKLGNWKISAGSGGRFHKDWFEIVDNMYGAVVQRVRYWDKAGTRDGGKYTAGVLMAQSEPGIFYVEDVVRGQWSALERERIIKNTASQDGPHVEVWTEQEPGSGGKESAEATVRNLAGFTVYIDRVTGSKWARSGPLSAQVEAGNVKLLRGTWNRAYINELHNFSPEADKGAMVCDQVDASSGAFNQLTAGNRAFAA